MKIKLTADTRVLLSAGTIVDVSNDTASVILKLGRCEIVDEAAEEKAEEVKAPKKESKPRAPKKKD